MNFLVEQHKKYVNYWLIEYNNEIDKKKYSIAKVKFLSQRVREAENTLKLAQDIQRQLNQLCECEIFKGFKIQD